VWPIVALVAAHLTTEGLLRQTLGGNLQLLLGIMLYQQLFAVLLLNRFVIGFDIVAGIFIPIGLWVSHTGYTLWLFISTRGWERLIGFTLGLLLPMVLIGAIAVRDTLPEEISNRCDLQAWGDSVQVYHARYRRYPVMLDDATLQKILNSPELFEHREACKDAWRRHWLYTFNGLSYDVFLTTAGQRYILQDDAYALGYVYRLWWLDWLGPRVCHYVPARGDVRCGFNDWGPFPLER
jgi:hypothetical protein